MLKMQNTSPYNEMGGHNSAYQVIHTQNHRTWHLQLFWQRQFKQKERHDTVNLGKQFSKLPKCTP